MIYKQTYNKYNNKKITRNGITYDSIKEANRHCELIWLERAGEVSQLQRQVKYELIPSQYENILLANGKYKKVCVEKSCGYVADFVYTDKNGNVVVEDVKGIKTEVYKIKRKLMLYIHNIKIKEV